MLTQEQRVRLAAETLVKQATIAAKACALSDGLGAATVLEQALAMAVARMIGVNPSPERVRQGIIRTTEQLTDDIPMFVVAGYASLEIKLK